MNNKLPKGWASRRIPGHNDHIPGTTNYLRSRTFQTYFNMIVRCYYESSKDFENYGGRGIQVDPRWIESFDLFIQEVGHRPKGRTLDRINPDLGYYPENVRWSSVSVQSSNKRNRRK